MVQTTRLPKGTLLFRFHGPTFAANSFNPNSGRRIRLPKDGSRFNPFPGAPASNIPTLYAATTLKAAALESVFHDIEHIPSPKYPKIRLADWQYTKLKTTRDLLLFRLVNPQLKQLSVPGRSTSLTESELIHTPLMQYPNTRTWAQFLHDSIPNLEGLAWRPRLGGEGLSFVFFGDRCAAGDFRIQSSAISASKGKGLAKVSRIAKQANIEMFEP